MATQQSQIKINLPLQLKKHIENRAKKHGIPITGYIKHLIIKDKEEKEEYPVYEASEATVKAYKQALKDRKKAIKVTDMKEFLDSL